jgi:molecular chaperone GrpE (heat shock protein)
MSPSEAPDPYAGMTPGYGSADVFDGSALSAEILLPPVATSAETAATEPPEGRSDDPAPAGAEPERAEPVTGPRPAESPAAGVDASRPAGEPFDSDLMLRGELAALRAQTAEVAARQAEGLAAMTTQLSELLRLRVRDVDLADRLYAENTRLRTGEFAAAVAPLLSGLMRLHDQMASLAGGDTASVAGHLRTQLLQILDTAAGLAPFEPLPGERFDAVRHAGAGRAVTTDPAAEGTVAKSLKPGFERADGTIVRVAQVEVYRFESR